MPKNGKTVAIHSSSLRQGETLLRSASEKGDVHDSPLLQAIKHQEWTAALQVEHGKTAAKHSAELQATAAALEAK